jgi:hypothetical protein
MRPSRAGQCALRVAPTDAAIQLQVLLGLLKAVRTAHTFMQTDVLRMRARVSARSCSVLCVSDRWSSAD